MSDLISRSKLIEALTKCKQLGRKSFEVVVNVINEQPTAYNVDTVVAELDKKAKRHGGEDYFVEFGDAVEIVKQGGVSDDVCEWKSVRDGEFIKNPHTRRTFSNEPSMQNVYCNTCGKKIKVVG